MRYGKHWRTVRGVLHKVLASIVDEINSLAADTEHGEVICPHPNFRGKTDERESSRRP
jgi:hypothetical protein